ncbi:hypothetical protein KFK09_024697 [Dendrobium nobile]|uniref:Uncharacterized protein n=1 Tax=Dendrobium nobile TaxID=94219 RepID=A0A8T3AEJ2_DENNO|nr:hypothetical protein KFK09_024697 [Dendrobium nobile]
MNRTEEGEIVINAGIINQAWVESLVGVHMTRPVDERDLRGPVVRSPTGERCHLWCRWVVTNEGPMEDNGSSGLGGRRSDVCSDLVARGCPDHGCWNQMRFSGQIFSILICVRNNHAGSACELHDSSLLNPAALTAEAQNDTKSGDALGGTSITAVDQREVGNSDIVGSRVKRNSIVNAPIAEDNISRKTTVNGGSPYRYNPWGNVTDGVITRPRVPCGAGDDYAMEGCAKRTDGDGVTEVIFGVALRADGEGDDVGAV